MLQQFISLTICFAVVGATLTRTDFACFEDKSMVNKVRFYGGMVLTCPQNYICNTNAVYSNSPPCVYPKCWGDWGCKADANSSLVVIRDLEFACPKFTTCQLPTNNDCIPCVATKCASIKRIECNEMTPGRFREAKNGSEWTNCAEGHVCNTRWEEPCTPCIADNFGALLAKAVA